MYPDKLSYGGFILRKIVYILVLCILILNLSACSTTPVDTQSGIDEQTLYYPAENPSYKEEVNLNNSGEVNIDEVPPTNTDISDINNVSTEMRGIWISYLDYEGLLKGKNESEANSSIRSAFENIKEKGFNTLFLQVRPFSDALYNSSYFPWSHILTGEQSLDPGYDPLSMMIEIGKSMDLSIHAWINPYRVKLPSRPDVLSEDNIAKQWLDSGSLNVIETSEGVFLNPASPESIDLVLNGVEEIVANYDVDGIHFDDYFYPTTDTSFDELSYTEYLSSGGELELDEWRLENVNTLIKKTYEIIKSINKDAVFGISPQGNLSNNYKTQYADVKTWCGNSGYIDYIMPQVYYGYDHQTNSYTDTILEWQSIITDDNVKLYVGLAGYKVGVSDKWAGDASEEWVGKSDILMRQVIDARTLGQYGGFVLYRYDSIFNPEDSVSGVVEIEMNNLRSIF